MTTADDGGQTQSARPSPAPFPEWGQFWPGVLERQATLHPLANRQAEAQARRLLLGHAAGSVAKIVDALRAPTLAKLLGVAGK